MARRETPSHLSSPDGLIPARRLRRADTCQSSMPPHTCTHTCTYTCTHTYMCAHSCRHLRALCVPGLSLNIPHLACPACPLNPSSRVRPCLVMPALGCRLSAPQRPPAPGACLDLHVCFFAMALRASSFMYTSMPTPFKGLAGSIQTCRKIPSTRTSYTRAPLFPQTCGRAWDPLGAQDTMTGPWESRAGLGTSNLWGLSPSSTGGGLPMALASRLRSSFTRVPRK